MKYVIIGAGPAGVRAAETLREADAGASITLVSGEPGEPYARMAIPYILTGRITEEGAQQRKTAGHFESLGIRYLNNKAMQVRAGADGGSVDLDDGSRLEYDRLLVATGSSPTLPPIERHRSRTELSPAGHWKMRARSPPNSSPARRSSWWARASLPASA